MPLTGASGMVGQKPPQHLDARGNSGVRLPRDAGVRHGLGEFGDEIVRVATGDGQLVSHFLEDGMGSRRPARTKWSRKTFSLPAPRHQPKLRLGVFLNPRLVPQEYVL